MSYVFVKKLKIPSNVTIDDKYLLSMKKSIQLTTKTTDNNTDIIIKSFVKIIYCIRNKLTSVRKDDHLYELSELIVFLDHYLSNRMSSEIFIYGILYIDNYFRLIKSDNNINVNRFMRIFSELCYDLQIVLVNTINGNTKVVTDNYINNISIKKILFNL